MSAELIDPPAAGPRGWHDLPLTEEHAAYLAKHAIEPHVAEAIGVYSVTEADKLPAGFSWMQENSLPALVFPWKEPSGATKPQLRPSPEGGLDAKYLSEEDNHAQLVEVRPGDGPVLIVEGSKQMLAAASYAPADVAVYGVTGCLAWMKDGVPTPHLSVVHDREALIALDGDVNSNLNVYSAATKLADACRAEGASAVKFVRLPAGGKAGLDDVLASQPVERRAGYLQRLIEGAKLKPADSKPTKTSTRPALGSVGQSPPGDRFFDKDGLLVKTLSEVIRDQAPAALTEERKVALYQNGVYHMDETAFSSVVSELLGERFRQNHRAAVAEFTAGMLYKQGLFLPLHCDEPLLNVRNGMLDLVTGTLKPHDPAYLSGIQIPIEWDPEATCPTYEEWIEMCEVSDQLDDLEETTATMLDPSKTPPKAVFLFGPSRSAKSTYLRLMQAIVGAANMSAVTLHQLASNRFMAANVYNKMLNCAADLSSAHVEDISIFKMMTGEDPIQADRKNGAQFAFTNRALFAFSANELPTVGESSRAYTERIKPFEFGKSFAGKEDPTLEVRMRQELPGILVRWVRAWQRRNERGTYLPSNPRVMKEFETRSDRVRQWLEEQCVIWSETPDGKLVTHGTSLPAKRCTEKSKLAAEFNAWAEQNSGSKMGPRKIADRLSHIPGVHEVRQAPAKKRALNITVRDESDQIWDEETGSEGPDDTPGGPGGSFEGPGGSFEGPGGSFGSETATENPQVTGPISNGVAGVAVSEHYAAGQKIISPDVVAKEVTESSQKNIFSGSAAQWVETATPTTPATPTNQIISDEPDDFGHGTIDLDAWVTDGDVDLPEGVVVFDIESADNNLWPLRPDFIRVTGVQQGRTIRVTADAAEVAGILREAKLVVGHNIMGFDLLAFALHHGVDLHQLAAEGRIVDTMINQVLTDPPEARTKQGQIMRSLGLDALGEAKGLGGKSHDLKKLAKKHGGYDQIPVNDAEYVSYCAQDVNLTAKLIRSQGGRSNYARREMQVAALAAQIRMNGFRVDVDLNEDRFIAGERLRQQRLEELNDRYGMPLPSEKVKAPHQTKAGKLALAAAFEDLGVELGKTPSGLPAFGKEAREQIVEDYADHPDVLELCDAVGSLLGIRTVFGTVRRCLVGDRVHPDITMFQSSGRWSITEPGLTVMGKRGGKYTEREIFLPEPGHVIIAADLSQVDARVVAAFSQDEGYFELFADGRDLHAEVAAAALGDPARREEAKALGHGWNYGMGIKSLAKKIGNEDVAREFDRGMKERYPKLVKWKADTAERADSGKLLDNGFGRKLRTTPERGWTQGPALMGQSAARDILMEGLLRMPAEFYPYLRAVIHDEIVMSVPEDQVERISAQVVEAMCFPWAPPGAEMKIDIKAECSKPGHNWGKVYEK